MADRVLKIDPKSGRVRHKPLTQKQQAAARARAANLPQIYATPPRNTPAAPSEVSPEEERDGLAEGADGAGGAGGTRGSTPAASRERTPAPYDYARDEPTHGTYGNDRPPYDIPQAKQRGPVRSDDILHCSSYIKKTNRVGLSTLENLWARFPSGHGL